MRLSTQILLSIVAFSAVARAGIGYNQQCPDLNLGDSKTLTYEGEEGTIWQVVDSGILKYKILRVNNDVPGVFTPDGSHIPNSQGIREYCENGVYKMEFIVERFPKKNPDDHRYYDPDEKKPKVKVKHIKSISIRGSDLVMTYRIEDLAGNLQEEREAVFHPQAGPPPDQE